MQLAQMADTQGQISVNAIYWSLTSDASAFRRDVKVIRI
jgi:hypothetical protein